MGSSESNEDPKAKGIILDLEVSGECKYVSKSNIDIRGEKR